MQTVSPKQIATPDFGDGPRSVLVENIDPQRWVALQEFVGLLQPADIRLRFGTPRRFASDEAILAAFQSHYPDHEMIWALTDNGSVGGIVSCGLVGRSKLELAIIVRSDLKREGIGTWLLEQAKRRAQQRQIQTLIGFVLWDNLPMRALAKRAGFTAIGTGDSFAELEFSFRNEALVRGAPRLGRL